MRNRTDRSDRGTATRKLGPLWIAMAMLLAAVAPGWATGGDEREPLDPPAVSDASWWSDVQRQIEASEYEITWQDRAVLPDLDGAWQAPNRSQNLRLFFTEEGLRAIRRTEVEPTWELGLALVGFGRGDRLSPIEPATLSANGNRIDLARGEITEWYVNEPRGLEQGFTLHRPPEQFIAREEADWPVAGSRGLRPGEEGSAPAYLVLELRGSLSPVISADAQAIDFAVPGGARVLHYSELLVTDARGRQLPAWLEGFAEEGLRGIRLVFDDASAAYPLRVDPLLQSPSWSTVSNQADAYYGFSTSTAGDVNGDGYSDVIVGAYLYDHGQVDEGRAFVFHGSAAGLVASPVWSAESDQAGARFGLSVSTAGDVDGDGFSDVIVGAYSYDNGETDEGRAYVFLGSRTGLEATASWTAENNQASSRFGYSVSTAGDINGDGYSEVIVGAYYYDGDQGNEGRAYVFHGSAAGPSVKADWTAEGNQASAYFGHCVSSAGDVNGDGYGDVIIGAHYYDNGEANEGRAFVFHGSKSGLSSAPNWTAESDQASAYFGKSVSTAGDVNADGFADVVVGAYMYDNGQTDEGRAWVFHGSAFGLRTTPAAILESDQEGAYFGYSVATAGDVDADGFADVVVGAYRYDNGELNEGTAFVYFGSASGLDPAPGWLGEGEQPDASFGISVATAGDVNGDGCSDVIVGAHRYDSSESNEGAAFVYHGSPDGLSREEGWRQGSDQFGGAFGYSVSTAGDVNGDGYADVIVGALLYDHLTGDGGRAFVYHGSASGLSTTADWTVDGEHINGCLGASVSTAGDVNGDGYADVIVGVPHADVDGLDVGQVHVYHGSATGLSTTPDWTASGDQYWDIFGEHVAAAGDVNGDGYGDVIVGATFYSHGQQAEGRVYLYHGSAAGLSPVPDWVAEGDQAGAYYGAAIAAAGDVNGDGYGDLIVGAFPFDNGESGEGKAYLYHGSATGLGATPDWTAEGNRSGAGFGKSVSTAGDVNGDGYSDVIVGAWTHTNGEYAEGRAYVYLGSATGLGATHAWMDEGDQEIACFGVAVSTAGDVNGDGYADIIVGAYAYDGDATDEGRVFAYYGSASGPSASPDWWVGSHQEDTRFGGSVSTAGDVNGDGYADVIVGAEDYDDGEPSEGAAFLYYGGGGAGPSLVPQSWQPAEDVPISPLGRSSATDRVRLRLRGRSPFAGGRAKLEWEVEPLGTLFDGRGLGRSASWIRLSGSVPQYTQTVSSLDARTPYHWRVRLRYEPASLPYKPHSRWLTVPLDGWNETDLRTEAPDNDADGYTGYFDCDDANPDVWSLPGEAVELVVAADRVTFSWDPPSPPTGVPGTTRYDLLRSPLSDDFVGTATCAAMDILLTKTVDTLFPDPGEYLAYLVRAENACGEGSLGQTSYPGERVGRTCP